MPRLRARNESDARHLGRHSDLERRKLRAQMKPWGGQSGGSSSGPRLKATRRGPRKTRSEAPMMGSLGGQTGGYLGSQDNP
ncbi:MAG: hypothetical protein QOG21_2114 [Actinomycetota bacterium]|jgi:hypothetical protein|nr:hypothetical protein [Actinomycetota bacterium]